MGTPRQSVLEVHHVAELIATRRMLEPIVYHLAADNASQEELTGSRMRSH
jgi:DNA-binding FadR family transcriptional regulator